MKDYVNIYMVGIKGFGMASLAYLLQKMGKKVTGSDIDESFPTDEILHEAGIKALIGYKPENVPADTDLVITTGAYGGLQNPEVLAAVQKGIPAMTHAEALGHVMDLFENRIAVCGTHGKTTTSAMMSFILFKMGESVGYQVGAPSFSGLHGGDYTGDKYCVVESDEYATTAGTDNTPRFMYQNPNYILCTNIDYDHVDVYENLEAVKKAFQNFFLKPRVRKVIYSYEDENSRDVIQNSHVEAISVGTSSEAHIHIRNVRVDDGQTLFDLEDFGTFSLAVPGVHNVRNAAEVLVVLNQLGINLDDVRPILAQFHGSKRRFERIFEDKDNILIDDYAHHPHELEALIQGTRMLFPDRRLILLFQPHMYSRTQELKKDFIEVLKKADITYVLDIFASARETSEGFSITSKQLAEEAHSDTFHWALKSDIPELLKSQLKPGDIIITSGAGDIYKLHPAIIEACFPN